MGLPNYAANVSYTGIEGIAFTPAVVEARDQVSDSPAKDTLGLEPSDEIRAPPSSISKSSKASGTSSLTNLGGLAKASGRKITTRFRSKKKQSEPISSPGLGPVIRAKPFVSLSEPWNRTTSMSSSIQVARTWLTTCLAEHDDCGRNPRFCRIYGGGSTHQVIHLDHDTAMPSRLLQIFDDQVKLVKVNLQYIEYVALSHCWGKLRTITTTSENLARMTTGIALSSLPKTYADAIEFTKGLGYRHIWIDSLCIVQDDKKDWHEQAPRMACIYGNAICTLSASDAPDNSAGLFVADSSNRGVLDTRGWVLQERMISPRSILFSDNKISYECRQCNATSDSPSMVTRPRIDAVNAEHPKDLFVFFRDFELPSVSIRYKENNSMVFLDDVQELMGRDDLVHFKRVWWKLIQNFSTLNLTKPADKFVAISGITNTVLRNIHVKNYYGLWGGHDLIFELLWYVDLEGPEGDHGWDFLGPTWSWASLHSGRVRHDLWHLDKKAKTRLMVKPWIGLPYCTSFEHELPYQPWCTIGSLSIDLKGNLRRATIEKHANENSHTNGYQVKIEPAGRISDHEIFEFRPDAANEFPANHPVEVTCLYFTNHPKGTVDDKYHVDVYLVLNKMHVYENEQGNLHPDGERLRFWFKTPRYGLDNKGQMCFVTNTFEPSEVEDERVANQRTFLRMGYLLVRYEERRDEEDIYEDQFWRFVRIV